MIMPGQVERSIQNNGRQWSLNIPAAFALLMEFHPHEPVSLEFVSDKDDPRIIIRKVKK